MTVGGYSCNLASWVTVQYTFSSFDGRNLTEILIEAKMMKGYLLFSSVDGENSVGNRKLGEKIKKKKSPIKMTSVTTD